MQINTAPPSQLRPAVSRRQFAAVLSEPYMAQLACRLRGKRNRRHARASSSTACEEKARRVRRLASSGPPAAICVMSSHSRISTKPNYAKHLAAGFFMQDRSESKITSPHQACAAGNAWCLSNAAVTANIRNVRTLQDQTFRKAEPQNDTSPAHAQHQARNRFPVCSVGRMT